MNCIIKSFNPLSLFVGVGDCYPLYLNREICFDSQSPLIMGNKYLQIFTLCSECFQFNLFTMTTSIQQTDLV